MLALLNDIRLEINCSVYTCLNYFITFLLSLLSPGEKKRAIFQHLLD